MKKTVDQFKGKTPLELKKMVLEFKKELFNLRFQQASRELTKPHKIGYIKRSIARINTILNRKEHTKEESHAKARVKRKSS